MIIAHNFLGKRLAQCTIASVYADGADCCANGRRGGVSKCEGVGIADYNTLLTPALGNRVRVGGPALCPGSERLETLEKTQKNTNAAAYRTAYNQITDDKWQALKEEVDSGRVFKVGLT